MGARSSRRTTSSTRSRVWASARCTDGRLNICEKKLPWFARWRPSSRFSSTVAPSNSSMFWNVRAMPWRTTSCRASREMSCPLKRMLPLLASNTRVMRFKSDVLPAPFGPITARISPARIEKLTSRTAFTPPNDRLSRSTSKNAGLIGSAPISCRPWSCGRCSCAPRGTRPATLRMRTQREFRPPGSSRTKKVSTAP